MNLKHLGDALDGWKSWLLPMVRDNERTLRIIPMFTDVCAWTEDHRRLYEKLLHVAAKDLVNALDHFNDLGRESYFRKAKEALAEGDDVFVDPDNGPWTGKAKDNPDKYIKVCELVQLISDSARRTVFVYRHESFSQTLQGLESDIGELLAPPMRCWAFGFWCGVTTLIALSHDKTRLSGIRESLVEYMHPVGCSKVTSLIPVLDQVSNRP